jgi:hypothetical protein
VVRRMSKESAIRSLLSYHVVSTLDVMHLLINRCL